MAIRAIKVAEVAGSIIVPLSSKAGDLAAILTNFESVSQPAAECQWQFDFVIGEGTAARAVKIELATFISSSDYSKSNKEPILLNVESDKANPIVIFFRGRFFLPERPMYTEEDKQEVILRVKKLTYDDDTELVRLRSAVANIEAAVEYTKSGPVRGVIPDDVKMRVWARDGGACVNCGSKDKLQFDHIIPVAKGGGDTAENIQVLCAQCNLRKSASIAIPQPPDI